MVEGCGRVLLLALLLAGCQAPAPAPAPDAELDSLRADIAALEGAVVVGGEAQTELVEAQFHVRQSLDELAAKLAKLDGQVARTCQVQAVAQETCDAKPRRVQVRDDKIVVGEIENVWVDPPGIQVTARVDTGATSSSLHASNITEFERDGDDWVRFDIVFEGVDTTMERLVEKQVRVFQQSDKEGTIRPVVKMRIFLGDLQDTYEFTLADRSHLEHIMILGRNFLKDVALVDVSRAFVQPAYQPAGR